MPCKSRDLNLKLPFEKKIPVVEAAVGCDVVAGAVVPGDVVSAPVVPLMVVLSTVLVPLRVVV